MKPRPLLRKSEVAAIAATFFTLSIPIAVVHIEAGTEPWLVLAASWIVISATATLAFAAVTVAGGSVLSGVLGGWLVSTRFGLLAAAVSPRLWPRRSAKAAAALVTLDPNVALALNEPAEAGTSRRVFVTMSLALVVPWWLGSVVGVLIGEQIGDVSVWGFDAMFPAMFVAIIWPRLHERQLPVVGLSAAVIAVALIEPLPAGLSILIAAFMAFWVLLPNRHQAGKPETREGKPGWEQSQESEC